MQQKTPHAFVFIENNTHTALTFSSFDTKEKIKFTWPCLQFLVLIVQLHDRNRNLGKTRERKIELCRTNFRDGANLIWDQNQENKFCKNFCP